jgi:hypothetical protein
MDHAALRYREGGGRVIGATPRGTVSFDEVQGGQGVRRGLAALSEIIGERVAGRIGELVENSLARWAPQTPTSDSCFDNPPGPSNLPSR